MLRSSYGQATRRSSRRPTTSQQQQIAAPALSAMPTLSPTAASAADADRAALHTTTSGVPNEHVSRLRQWFCSCASTTITPAAERINWYGKQTNCCIGSTERLQRAPARALTLMTMGDDDCSCFLDELGQCNGFPRSGSNSAEPGRVLTSSCGTPSKPA